jgi:hypothetical protein
MKSSSGFFILVIIFLGTSGFSQNNETADVSSEIKSNIFVVCQRQKEQRWLRAYKLENGRCKALYSKEGYVQVVSSASYFSSCEAVLNTVKKNIEEGGFKCGEKALATMIEIE